MWKIYRQSGEYLEGPEMERLASALGRVSGESCLDEADRLEMKKSLLAMIGTADPAADAVLERLEHEVVAVGSQVKLSARQKKIIWEEVIAGMHRHWLSSLSSLWLFRNWRSSLASLLVFSVMLGFFVAAPFELRLTRASKWTYLEKVEGEVYINRNGRVWAADPHFALQEGDLIVTRQNSFVAIRFLDDSVTRLGADTSLQIGALHVHPDNAVNTRIELTLISGQVWASVHNLIGGDSLFSIETDNARADVNSRAAFEISSLNAVTRLAVFDNMVEVSKKAGRVSAAQTVVAGFQAEVSDNPDLLARAGSEILVQKIGPVDSSWVETNQALDQQHLIALKAENQQFIVDSVASSQTLGLLADFRDGTKALFANAEIEKARQKFLDVHLGFIRAQEYLVKADRGNDYRRQATPLLIQYRVAIAEIAAASETMRSIDVEQTDALLQMMREEVDLQRKALSLVLPNDPLYTAKQVVMEAAGYFAGTAAERAIYLLDRSRNRLLEMQGLIAKNNLQDAEAVFRTYLNGLNALVQEVESAQVSEIETHLFALLDEQIKQFKLLTAIESELQAKNDQRLTGLVGAVKQDSLGKLVEIISVYRQNGFPLSTLLGLESTVHEFFPDSPDKSYYLAELEQVLLTYPEYLASLEQSALEQAVSKTVEDIPSESVIVDLQSSSELSVCASDCAEQQTEDTEKSS